MRFKRKYKTYTLYKRFKTDFWGKISSSYKNNKITNFFVEQAEAGLRSVISRIKSRRRRIKIYSKFPREITQNIFKKFTFEVKSFAKGKQKKPLTYHSRMLDLRRKLLIFYADQYRNKPLRKFSWTTRFGQRKYYVFSYDNKKQLMYNEMKSFTHLYETRLDILVCRALFTHSLFEARRLLRVRNVLVCSRPHNKRVFKYYTPIKYETLLKPFTFFTLVFPLRIRRKIYLMKELYSFRMLMYPAKHIMVNFITMFAFRLPMPPDNYIRYSFSKALDSSYIPGFTRYF